MAIVLQVKDALKRYGGVRLLDNASFSMTDSQKVGLIGRNGCGKTTLCRAIIGEDELETGDIIKARDLRLGYLRQDNPFLPGETVIEFLQRDTGSPDWRCGEIAWQFEIGKPRLDGQVSALSSGWQTRVKLAALLLRNPNLLVLDEPTNFLDLRTQILLERFLKGFRGGCLMVSHDRAFLRNVCTHTLELENGKLTMFPGDVDSWIAHKQKQREVDEKTNAVIVARRRQLQDFIDRNRVRAATASRAQAKIKMLEKLKVKELDSPEDTARIRLPSVERRKGWALSCEDLEIGYPSFKVAGGICFDVNHGSRVAVVGDNGQGKTTFLRTITRDIPSLGGGFRWSQNAKFGFYAQNVYESLKEGGTVLEYLSRRADPRTPPAVFRNLAGCFLFSGDDAEKQVSVLSGGERARLCLAGLLLGGFNVLVLDEPGNHLDVETVDALADALNEYEGTVVFTSHDRHFLERTATTVIEVRDGRVALFPGDYREYVDHVLLEIAAGERDPKDRPARQPAPPHPDKDVRKERARALHALQRELSSAEKQLERLGERKAELNRQFLASSNPSEAQRLHAEISAVSGKITALEERWMTLHEELNKPSA